MLEQVDTLIEKARRFAAMPVDQLAQQNVKRLLGDLADALDEVTKSRRLAVYDDKN